MMSNKEFLMEKQSLADMIQKYPGGFRQFAVDIPMTEVQLHNILNGKHWPRTEAASRMAELLGIETFKEFLAILPERQEQQS
jgi:hypothetical protein